MPRLPAVLKLKGKISTGEVWIDGKLCLLKEALQFVTIAQRDFHGAISVRVPPSLLLQFYLGISLKGRPLPCIKTSSGSSLQTFLRRILRQRSISANGLPGQGLKRVTMIYDVSYRKPALWSH